MIPLVAPTITALDRQALSEAAMFGDMLTSERTVRQFEEAFAERVGCAGAVAVCSGTAALRLALNVLGVRNGDGVTLPTYACSALLNALERAVHPVFVDSKFDVREASMAQAQATVVVHAFGRDTLGWPTLVEDWTLSLGYPASLRSDIGVCSTNASKMISTGRGGVVFSNDTALLDEVRELAYYDTVPNGRLGAYSLGMSSMQAALGLSQLRQLDSFIERRRAIATYYSSRLGAALEVPDPHCGSVFFRYLIGVDNPSEKVARLKELGVEAGRGMYPPLHRQLGLPDDEFPGATECVNRLLSVPLHPSLTDAQVAFVAEKVLEVCA